VRFDLVSDEKHKSARGTGPGLKKSDSLAKLHATAKLVKGFRIDVDDGRKHAICLDLPIDDDGTDMGPSALELTLMSYVGCYVTIFALTAEKMRITPKDLQVDSEAVKSEDAGTITQVRVDILVLADAPQDRIKRAHELTLKTCPVGILFEKAGVKMEYRLRMER
jgi:putative redox protein